MTREEAIKKIKLEMTGQIIDKDVRDVLEALIPELRESKDERVRKAILGLTYLDGIEPILTKCSITAGDIRAYLEKQKEEEGYEAIPVESTLGYKLGFKAGKESEKQKEQKPWKVGANAYFTPEQKPAGWSEEDDQLIGFIFDLLNDLFWRKDWAMSKEECLERLKSLRPSWKPSEQEKGALRTAIHILTDERNFPKAAAQLQNILNAFEGEKSRKDWKPNEEQKEALERYVEYLEESDNEDADILAGLYEQLKAL